VRKWLLATLCLTSCATAPTFTPIGNCVLSFEQGVFSCVDPYGKTSKVPWLQATDLVCFHAPEFKEYAETCRSR
jgi:hypothetical protein